MRMLMGLRVAILATDGVEELQLTEPLFALRDNGANAEVISILDRPILAFHHFERGEPILVDRRLADACPEDYDALVLPGGYVSVQTLRAWPDAIRFVESIDSAHKPIAAICYGVGLLAAANLIQGRRVTGSESVADEIRQAGGGWVDRPVVFDGNWATCRCSNDIPEFIDAMFQLFDRVPVAVLH